MAWRNYEMEGEVHFEGLSAIDTLTLCGMTGGGLRTETTAVVTCKGCLAASSEIRRRGRMRLQVPAR